MPEETAFFMKSSSKQFLAQSLQNMPLCTNTVLHSFSWRCLLVLTFFCLMTQQSIIIAELYNVSYCNFERFELLQCDERASQKQQRGAHNFQNAIFIEKSLQKDLFIKNQTKTVMKTVVKLLQFWFDFFMKMSRMLYGRHFFPIWIWCIILLKIYLDHKAKYTGKRSKLWVWSFLSDHVLRMGLNYQECMAISIHNCH